MDHPIDQALIDEVQETAPGAGITSPIPSYLILSSNNDFFGLDLAVQELEG